MRFRSPRLALAATLMMIALASGACGWSTDSAPGAAMPTVTPTLAPTFPPTPTATPDPSLAVAPNPPGDADVAVGTNPDGLHVHLIGYVQRHGAWASSGFLCGYWIVLAASAPQNSFYGSGAIDAISSYMGAAPLGPGLIPLPSPTTPLPPTLRLVSAAEGSACNATLQVTNNTAASVSLDRAGVKFSASPTVNDYHYALLDACTINFARYCSGRGGQIGGCQYFVTGALTTGGRDTEVSAPITPNDPSCPAALLGPGETLEVNLEFSPPPGADNLLFHVVPELTWTDTSTHTSAFTTMPNTLVYADQNQFACYALQGSGFVRESSVGTVNNGAQSLCV